MSEERPERPEFDETKTAHPSSGPAKEIGADLSASISVPEQIGHYRVKRLIGVGGMGAVYEAIQDKPERSVAVKVMKRGLASTTALRRFEQEAQLLGRLQHNGIAQVYEAGVAESEGEPLPYFAMELIHGLPLCAHADQKRLGIRARLELLASICDAVHHAHQKGVIHRDLKPGNILVDPSGQPKILDFGVARATDADVQITTMRTDVAKIIGTLAYMSPEQVAADPANLDTRSDIYALGVIAYELLAGKLPYDLGRRMIHEVARVIREDDPTPLSAVNKVFRGDVEIIVAKALEKEKSRRYQSAAEMSTDIRRYLQDQPIVARPPSAMYQLRKFAKRNKALVGGVLGVVVALLAGLIVSTGMYFEAEAAREATAAERDRATAAEKEADTRRQEAEAARNGEREQRRLAEKNERQAIEAAERAQKEADKAVQIRVFLQDMLSSADPNSAPRPDLTVREILDKASLKVEAEFKDLPEIAAALRLTIGLAYHSLGNWPAVEKHLQVACAFLKEAYGTDYPDTLLCQSKLSEARFYQRKCGSVDEAREQLAATKRTYGDDSLFTAWAMHDLALGMTINGDPAEFEEAEKLGREAVAMSERNSDPNDPRRGTTLHAFGALLANIGKLEEGAASMQRGLEIARATGGVENTDVWMCMNDYASVLSYLGRYEETERIARERITIARKLFGNADARTAEVLTILSRFLCRRGRFAEAIEPATEALQARREIADRPAATAHDLDEYAGALLFIEPSNLKDPETALKYAQRAVAMDGGQEPEILDTLAQAYQQTGDVTKAIEFERQVLALVDPEEFRRLWYEERMAFFLRTNGDTDAAAQAYKALLDRLRTMTTENNPEVARISTELAGLYMELSRHEDAEVLLRESLKVQWEDESYDAPNVLAALIQLGDALVGQQKIAEARSLWSRALVKIPQTSEARNHRVAELFNRLISLPAPDADEPMPESPWPTGGTLVGELTDAADDSLMDVLDVTSARVEQNGEFMTFSVQTGGRFPVSHSAPDEFVRYIWFVDVDRDGGTGQKHGSLGSEFNVRALLRANSAQGFVDVTGTAPGGGPGVVTWDDRRLSITIQRAQIGSPSVFDWRVEACGKVAGVESGCGVETEVAGTKDLDGDRQNRMDTP